MITFTHKGDFSRASRYLGRVRKAVNPVQILNKYGQAGVRALASATPVQTGMTASAWGYEIEGGSGFAKIIFTNSHVNKNVNIAIILQYGHGTGTGGYVQGRDYINPAIQPIFDQIANEAWREVTSL